VGKTSRIQEGKERKGWDMKREAKDRSNLKKRGAK
jgi:hypothetical protein